MALPPFPIRCLATLLAVLLSSCLLFTDTEVADPLPEDTGSEDPSVDENDTLPTDTTDSTDTLSEIVDLDVPDPGQAEMGPADGDRRCVHRSIEIYDAEIEVWEEQEVCGREQHCLDGACVERPEGFGDSCEEDCDDQLGCIDNHCLTREPSVAGGECIGDEECVEGLLCTRRGYCQQGDVAEPCIDTEDCDPTVAPICDEGACAPAGVGEPCAGDDSCESDTLYCGPGGYCRAGSEGDPCGSSTQCALTSRYCGPDDVCHDGSTGDQCNATHDCEQIDDICKGSPLRCQDRVEGDACDSALECPASAPICSTESVCQDGGAGDDCQGHHDCGLEFHCAPTDSCEAGRGLGTACAAGPQCASGNCSNDHCAPVGFAYIPAGTFCMGSPDAHTECMGEKPTSERGRNSEETLHEVTLTRPLYLQETEVTQRQWTALGFTNPSNFDECGLDCPVETLNWWEAMAYVNALSEDEGLTPCYTLEGCDPSSAGTDIECDGITVSDPDASGNPYLCQGYRLPTEAEWERAYRAGTTTAFYNGEITVTSCGSDPNLDAIGWYCGNAGSTTHVVSLLDAVDGKTANDWGLYDMPGNVYEWAWDRYQSDYYASSPSSDPLGGTGSNRVRRGGSWNLSADGCRAANRSNNAPGYRGNLLGFRPARSALSIP